MKAPRPGHSPAMRFGSVFCFFVSVLRVCVTQTARKTSADEGVSSSSFLLLSPQRPFDAALRAEKEWMSQNWRTLFLATFFTNIKTLNGVNTKTPSGEITNGKITNGEITSGEKSEGYRLFAEPMWQPLCKILAYSLIFNQFRVQAIAIRLQATGGEDRPRQNTPMFLFLFCVPHLMELFTRT